MIVIAFIISFLLDGIISNIFPLNSIFYPLLSLVCLIVLYPFIHSEDYYKYAFFLGLAYDLIYTDTFVFYASLFLILSFLISKLYVLINDSKVGLVFIVIITICLFRSLTYLFVFLTGNISFNINILFRSIYSSLIINIIYTLILSFIMDSLNKKYRFKRGLRY